MAVAAVVTGDLVRSLSREESLSSSLSSRGVSREESAEAVLRSNCGGIAAMAAQRWGAEMAEKVAAQRRR